MFDLTATLFPDVQPYGLRPDSEAPLQQSALYARAVTALGAPVQYVALPGSGALVVSRKVPVLGNTAMISRGPRTLCAVTAQDLPRITGARHIIVNAEDATSARALSSAGFWRIGLARQIAELDLSPSPDAMAGALTGKWRNRLRHALQHDIQIVRGAMPPDPRHWLFSAEALEARHLGYQPMSNVMVAALAAARPGAAQLFVARRGGSVLGAMLFLRHGSTATYQIGWSTKAGRAISVNNLLMWRAMIDLSTLGIRRLDLGLADPALSPGLAHFKCGTGADLRQLGGTWFWSGSLPFGRRSTSVQASA